MMLDKWTHIDDNKPDSPVLCWAWGRHQGLSLARYEKGVWISILEGEGILDHVTHWIMIKWPVPPHEGYYPRHTDKDIDNG